MRAARVGQAMSTVRSAWIVVARTVHQGPPIRVTYAVTPMGGELAPALHQLRAWAQQWLV